MFHISQNTVIRPFFGRKWSLTPKPPLWPHSVIHNRKAVHLTIMKLWWKVNFWPPLKRQNFCDASGPNCYPHLISCPTRLFYKSCFFRVFQCDLGPLKHTLELKKKKTSNQCFFSIFDWSKRWSLGFWRGVHLFSYTTFFLLFQV